LIDKLKEIGFLGRNLSRWFIAVRFLIVPLLRKKTWWLPKLKKKVTEIEKNYEEWSIDSGRKKTLTKNFGRDY
jgi:hypothetical protein